MGPNLVPVKMLNRILNSYIMDIPEMLVYPDDEVMRDDVRRSPESSASAS